MNTDHTIRRRSVLSGLPLAAIAASLPALATDPPAPPSPVPGLVADYRTAQATLKAARTVHEARFDAMVKSLEDHPIMVYLPGLGLGHELKRWDRTSPEAIQGLYDQQYGLLSGKGGARFNNGQLVPIDLAVDRQRDLAQALQNFEDCRRAFLQRSEDVGEGPAADACDRAEQAVEAAWLALLAYSPRTPFEAAEKATAIWSVVAADPDMFSTDHLKALLGSMGGAV